MPGLPETMYCSQQIHISPMLPQILKQYAKSAIRTQPTDLLRWSAAYFRALSQNEAPPEKKRLEYPEPKNYMGLTPGLLKVLLSQIGKSPDVLITYPDLYMRWEGICMPQDELVKILLSAEIESAVAMPWYKIIAVAAGYLSDNLTQTMVLICNLLTEEPDGGSAMIPVDIFLLYYKFLAELDLSETKYMLNVYFYIGIDIPNLPSKYSKKLSLDLPMELNNLDLSVKKISTGSSVSDVPPEFENMYRDQVVEKSSVKSGGFDVSDPGTIKKQNDILKAKSERASSVSRTPSPAQTFSVSEVIGDHDLTSLEIPSTNEEKDTYNTKEEQEEESQEIKTTTHFESVPEEQSVKSSDQEQNFTPNLPQDQNESTHHEVNTLVSPYSQVESVTSKLLGRTLPHFHLNKYLATASPSMVTELESRFTGTDISSETHTIYMEEIGKSKAARLIVKPPNEQVRYQIDEVKGIGPVVDPETMTTFINYIKERAAFQHGMIMPRNITSFQCPPLENFKYMKKIEVEEDVPFVGCKNVY